MNKASKLLLALLILSGVITNTAYAIESEVDKDEVSVENFLPEEANPEEPISEEVEEDGEDGEDGNGEESDEEGSQVPSPSPEAESKEDKESDEETEDEEEIEELADLWILDLLENQIDNDGHLQAITDYINVIDSFDFTDELNEEEVGTSLEEVFERFINDFDPIESEFADQVIYTYHYFESEESDEETPVAFLNYHFVNDALSAVSFHFAEPDLENILSEEEVNNLSEEDVIAQDILELNPNVIGLVHKNKGEAYDTLIIPSGEEANVTLNFIEVTGTQLNIAESVSHAEEDMLNLINQYISEK